ncbi:unnamed protein product [Parnassius apollo]|uniref:(apollo) hypothetical protein n=1 Tax=Parnassius apollo TaxID=110799 RepID=A0A8S3XQM8_PARAO|nr:unnamed protein product [Parnassius apollo]
MKDLFGDSATNSTSQITAPSSRVENFADTSSMIKTPKSASITGCTSTQAVVAATQKRTSVKTASLKAENLRDLNQNVTIVNLIGSVHLVKKIELMICDNVLLGAFGIMGVCWTHTR